MGNTDSKYKAEEGHRNCELKMNPPERNFLVDKKGGKRRGIYFQY